MTDKQNMDCDRYIFTLDRPIPYQIKIAGQLSENWLDWVEQMDIHIETDSSGLVTTILTGIFDQAALLVQNQETFSGIDRCSR